MAQHPLVLLAFGTYCLLIANCNFELAAWVASWVELDEPRGSRQSPLPCCCYSSSNSCCYCCLPSRSRRFHRCLEAAKVAVEVSDWSSWAVEVALPKCLRSSSNSAMMLWECSRWNRATPHERRALLANSPTGSWGCCIETTIKLATIVMIAKMNLSRHCCKCYRSPFVPTMLNLDCSISSTMIYRPRWSLTCFPSR